jgi:hypothetical protein
MNRTILAIAAVPAVLAVVALAAWLGFSDGREHRSGTSAEAGGGSAG